MQIWFISIFPEMLSLLTDQGITQKAADAQRVTFNPLDLRDFAVNDYGKVDDRPFGGGPGMVMMAKPVIDALDHVAQQTEEKPFVVHLSPAGQPLQQKHLVELSKKSSLAVICSRYEGLDERVVQTRVDAEYSLGDFVVSGGELPALMLIDGLVRLIPGVLGSDQSALQDSFGGANLLDCEHFTRPESIDIDGVTHKVPEVLCSGNHKAIETWRQQRALERTQQRRPDLLGRVDLGQENESI